MRGRVDVVRFVLGGRQSRCCSLCIGWEAELMLSDLYRVGGRVDVVRVVSGGIRRSLICPLCIGWDHAQFNVKLASHRKVA